MSSLRSEGRTRWFVRARQAGLLSALPPRSWQTLSALLSFETCDGDCPFTPEHLAVALGISPDEAGGRLQELLLCAWNGMPLLELVYDGNGAVQGAHLSFLSLLDEGANAATENAAGGISKPTIPPSDLPSPERIVAPTSEVETEAKGRATGRSGPLMRDRTGGGEADDLRDRMEAIGLYPDQAEELLRRYPEDRLLRQLEWLPHRKPRNPAAYFIRAVEENWAAPKEVV